jgi:hypothetical protein
VPRLSKENDFPSSENSLISLGLKLRRTAGFKLTLTLKKISNTLAGYSDDTHQLLPFAILRFVNFDKLGAEPLDLMNKQCRS